jgi:excisionase family DNA binding protein
MSPDDDLLTTTQAAQLLHSSRQHVVDLCERGELPYVTSGNRRKIRRREVEALLDPPLRREDERSLWINYALAAKLIADPTEVITQAKDRLTRLRKDHPRSTVWFDRWQTALDAGPDAVLAIMTARTEVGQAMRSASPLSGLGLLSDEERTRVLATFRDHWRSNHGAAA